MITIYLPDDNMIAGWLDVFRDMGFSETDWCELTSETSKVLIDYGPCEERPSG